MASDIEALEARVAELERQLHFVLDVADRAQSTIEDSNTIIDGIVIPAILLLARDGDRRQLREWLAELEAQLLAFDEPGDRPDRRPVLRVRYWRKVLDEKPVWTGFHVDGWGPEEKDDRPTR